MRLAGAGGVRPIVLLAIATALAFLPCAALAGAAEAKGATGAEGTQSAPGAEPEFTPGIPGLKMEDVRDYKHLWREIEELKTWEQSDRITVAEYRVKIVEKTAHYLEFEGAAADKFITAASEAVSNLQTSFRQQRQISNEDASIYGVQSSFTGDLNATVARIDSVLGQQPRHKLFASDVRKWLLKLTFGPGEAKEAREATQAQPASPDKKAGGEKPATP